MRWALLACIALAGCATAPPPSPSPPVLDTRAALAAVRSAGTPAANEVAVVPLRDPQAVDLAEGAARAESAGRFDDAAKLLDRALALAGDDPVLLQSRAEVALASGELSAAAQWAARSYALGPKLGPLCRRQQETLLQVATLQARQGDATADARQAAAKAARDACTVTPPPRY